MAKDLLVLEPFYGGSHKQLVDTIMRSLDIIPGSTADLFTLPAKKWPWKARCSALLLSELIPENESYQTIFCSSVLSLSELIGIRRDLQKCRKIVYFHENQLVYPVQKTESLDFQFGFNQILTCLAADIIYFNSLYNMTSFLNAIPSFLCHIPGYKSKNVIGKISFKCEVLYFPVEFSQIPSSAATLDTDPNDKLHILWAHRWEHDKDPQAMFDVLLELQNNGFEFHVSVLGQGFTDVPSVFSEAKLKLKEGTIKNWGYLSSKQEYYSVLKSCDVAVSTAIHEFFGVSMMECFYCGCYPLCPNRLSYPELYPTECLYNTNRQLFKRLREFCRKPWLASELRKKMNFDFSLYDWKSLKPKFMNILGVSENYLAEKRQKIDL